MIRFLLLVALTSPFRGDFDVRGPRVDPAEFRVTRDIPAAPRGFARLRLDADVLARSNDLADVRVLDGRDRQVPYLVDRAVEPAGIALDVPPRRTDGGRAVYRFSLPFDALPEGSRIVFNAGSRVFSREVRLRRGEEASPRERRSENLGAVTWTSVDPEHDAPPLAFDLPASGVRSLELVVDDGDNAPLPIRSAHVLIPGAALRFFDPGTPLTLVYGNSAVAPPRYDLALLSSRVFAAPAVDIALPPASHVRDRASAAPKIFWVAVAVAALLLFAVLARLIAGRAASQ